MTVVDVVAVAYGGALGLVLLDFAAPYVQAWLGLHVPAGTAFAGCVVGAVASVVAVPLAAGLWPVLFAAVGCAAGLFAWAHRPRVSGGAR